MNKLNKILLIILFFNSCVNDRNTEVQLEKTLVNSNENCVYSANLKATDVIWSGFKTTDKIKVTGKFNKISSNKIQNKNEFSNLSELIEDLDFSIDLSSSSSGDEIRDLNLKNYFFNLLASNFVLNGKFENIEDDSVYVVLDFFGKQKKVKLGYAYKNKMIQIKGSIDLVESLGAIKAFESISNKCYDLHKGPDGVSKTWKEVDVLIKAPIIKSCN
tara:strand:+ start:1353 stop:2000 length:648 start_codon:yes stop_codon:yes gene_type:complete